MPGPLSDPGFLIEDVLPPGRDQPSHTPDQHSSRHSSREPFDEQLLHRRGGDQLEPDQREDVDHQRPSKRRYLGVANEVSDSLGLEDHEREEVKRLSQLDTHAMAIWHSGYMLALGRQQAESDCEIYLQGEFRGHATRKLQSILMEPTMSCYVGNLTSRTVRYMQQEPVMFGIPNCLVRVPGSGIWSRAFSRAVGRVYAVFRGEILKKTQISLSSTARKRDIVALTNHIAPQDFVTRKAHWIRTAFIRVYVVSWLQEGRPKSFWKFLDEKIIKLAEMGNRNEIMRFLEKVLLEDQKKYPAPPRRNKGGRRAAGIVPLPPSMPVWQRGIERVVEIIEAYEPDELDPNIPNDEENLGGEENEGIEEQQIGDEDAGGENGGAEGGSEGAGEVGQGNAEGGEEAG